ncbi:bifunctional DNA-formamidopyrimidine glycosylase/DNA-(apurinic or apyrimidinic site) lyase [Desulfosediminicola ganghwensis]|uniref:bifunctional DNA-formamidopyrimidine glycosylase/DNA-(apurinic or apyrimidinic site) lyase n=1 Tax=Desulfosediminicola ganghwensis TaxID=2569540 RepID=UPI0010AC8175|nr:bifunctional DNA-formamidopyrimidine glycosylase/DNA-(apurinic or apyrimidinic site) lyase [Desulfosediminicola ganghwensis]
MPELPEVETICRGIRPHINNREIIAISHSGKDLRQPLPITEMRLHMIGARVSSVTRRAKFLMVEMDNGTILIIHLGMTGNLGIFSPETPPAKHCHVQFLLDNGMELRYTDVRRFGSMNLVTAREVPMLEETFFRTSGPEPFSDAFNAKYLYDLSRSRSIPVKTFLMTNQVVVGVGNIYANESLFEAGIRPNRITSTIPRKKWTVIVEKIQTVLQHAIECGGSTISDYVNADQSSGYFQINFQVYGRANQPCRRCEGTITKSVIGGRASYYCPDCQH